jgi:putative phosphoribosyl transferase
MPFASRHDAGQKLGRHLLNEGVEVDVVVGLPRGGVVVAAEVAHVLHRPLETLVVRKIGHPLHREFAVGALAECEVVLLNEESIGTDPSVRERLADVIEEEEERLLQYQLRFHPSGRSDFRDKTVLLVDDGLATGATMEAAILSARRQGARKVVVGVPVASASAIIRLERVASDIFTVVMDPGFESVGSHYVTFPQTEDEEVMDLLRAEHANH